MNNIEGDFTLVKLSDIITKDDRSVATDFFSKNPTIDRSLSFESFDVGEVCGFLLHIEDPG